MNKLFLKVERSEQTGRSRSLSHRTLLCDSKKRSLLKGTARVDSGFVGNYYLIYDIVESWIHVVEGTSNDLCWVLGVVAGRAFLLMCE